MKKTFLLIWLPVSILVGIILGLIYFAETVSERVLVETTEKNHIKLQVKSIVSDLDHVVSDLIFLSEQHEFHELLDSREKYSPEDLAGDFLTLSLRKGFYDQIRFIDEKGMEIVRVNYNAGKPSIVPEMELQSKGKRYYFIDTLNLKKGEVFVSPLDLNIEKGEIELPFKPVIRFGTPVFDSYGNKRGIIILNYLGSVLINNLKAGATTAFGNAMLLNSDGYWLIGTSAEEEWGFMLKERKDKKINNAFPGAWQQILRMEKGQFSNSNGLFTFETIYPLLEGQKSSTGAVEPFAPSAAELGIKDYYWKIVSRVPPPLLYRISKELFRQLLTLYIILLILAAIGAWFIARANMRHRESEEALRKSETRLSSAQRIAHLGNWEWNLAEKRMYWSDEVYRILGQVPGKFDANLKNFLKTVHPADRKFVKQSFFNALRQKSLFNIDHRILLHDSRERVIVHEQATVDVDDKGRPLIISGTIQDITERKKAEEKLSQSNKLLDCISIAQSRFISNTHPHILFEKLLEDILLLTASEYGFIGEVFNDKEGGPYLKTHAITNISWNEETRELYEKFKSSGMEFYNLKSLFGAVITTAEPVISNDPANDRRRCGLPNGHPPLDKFLGLPLKSGDRLVGMVGIANRPGGYDDALVKYLGPVLVTSANIIDAFRSGERRKEAEARIRNLSRAVEHSPATVVVTNTNGKIEYVNPKFTEITGYTFEEAIGKNPRILKSGKTPPEEYRKLWSAITSGSEWHGEFCNKKKNGDIYWESASISPVKDAEGVITHFVAVKEDITEQKKAREALSKYATMLEESNRMKDLFTDIMSHDVLNPVGIIKNSVEMLLASEEAGRKREIMELIRDSSSDVIEMIGNASTFSKLEMIEKIECRVIDIGEILSEVIEKFEYELKEKSLTLHYPVAGPHPACVNAMIKDVFMNLLSNAVKYSLKGGRIEVHIEEREKGQVVSVKDYGSGIADKNKVRIFERFERIGMKGIKGSGLGLAIAKRIVELHEGEIWVEDNPGSGSIFYVSLPKVQKA
ncbi:MAG: PAS domain S-box protein [Deltaproteobacteria bacterium]|nr:PAS domain S-box protein [Deltaproteobacteria bacterium]